MRRLHLIPINALIHFFFFYLNLLNPPNCYLLNPRNLSQIIAWMVRRLISDKSSLLMEATRLLTFASSLFSQPHGRAGRSMTRTSSLVRLCRTSLARASMNPSRANLMVGDSRSCISRGMIIMRTIRNNSYVAYHI